MHVYQGEDTVLAWGLPITTTLAGAWLNSLIFHDDIKCITANGQMVIYVGANYTRFTHKFWEALSYS